MVLIGLRWYSAQAQLHTLEAVLLAGAEATARATSRALAEPGAQTEAVLQGLRSDDPRLRAALVLRSDGSVEAQVGAVSPEPALPRQTFQPGWSQPTERGLPPVQAAYVLDRPLSGGRTLCLVYDAEAMRQAWRGLVQPALVSLGLAAVCMALLFGWLLRRPLRAVREATAFAEALPQAEGSRLAMRESHLRDVDELRTALNAAAALVAGQRDALAFERARLRTVIDADDAHIYLKDREGRFVLVNASFLRLWSRTEAEVVGRTSLELFGDNPGLRISLDHDQQAWAQDGAYESQQRIKVDGHLHDVIITRRTVAAPGGQRLLMAVARDETTLRDQARELAYERTFARNVIDLTDHYILVKDTHLRYVLVNDAYAQTVGRRKDELLGNTPYDIFTDHTLIDAALVADRRVLAEGIEITQEEVVNYGQGKRLCIAHKRPITLTDGSTGVLAVIRDVTVERAREAALQQAVRRAQAAGQALEHSDANRASTHRLLSKLLETTLEGFWFIDIDARTVDLNPAMCRMLGHRRDEVIGRHIYDFVDEANQAIFERELEARRQGRSGAYEVSLRRSDGSFVECINNATAMVDADGLRIGSIGLWTEIGAMKSAEREVALTKATLDQALDAMADGFAVFDQQHRLLLWNRRYVELFPHLRDIVAKGVPMAVLADAAARALNPQASEAQRQAFIADRERRRFENPGTTEFESPNGSVVQSTDRRAANGSLVSLFRDITQSRASARALELARDAAEAAVIAKTQFLAAMSHEIRTPLNAVLGMNGLMLDTPLNAEQRRYVELIGKSGESLLTVINDILDLSRLEAGKMQLELVPFSLGGAIHDVVSMMSVRAQAKGLALQVDIAPDLPAAVVGDPSRMRQVLFNLIGNAIKFTEHGRVAISVSARNLGPEKVAIGVAIADTGIGVAAEHLPRLFERFSQADSSTARRYGGSGLGLSISREIVGLMGGDIRVQSQPGAGSTFSFDIELARADISAGPDSFAQTIVVAAGLEPEGGLRILVAEDNSVNQILIRAMLARLGHYLDVVGDGQEALHQVQAAPYDLVLMDVQMPRLDGFAATRAIRALHSKVASIPIVAMTANVMEEDRLACAAAGMNDFLTKPIDRAHLREVIERAARREAPKPS